MKQKRPFTTGEKLMTAVMALCLAAACVMGVLFFRVTRENSEAEKEQVLLEQSALATAAPTARLEPTKQEPQTTGSPSLPGGTDGGTDRNSRATGNGKRERRRD